MPDSPRVIERRGLPVIAHPCAWYGTQMQQQSDWQIELSAPERAKLSRAVDRFHIDGVPLVAPLEPR